MSQQHSEELHSPNNSQNIRNIEEQISSILPSEAIPNETKEEEIRKRMGFDTNSSPIWNVFTLYKNDEPTKKIDLIDIFKMPHQGSTRLCHTKEYKELLNDENKYSLKCNFCESTFTFYKTSKSCPEALKHIEEFHPEYMKFKNPEMKRKLKGKVKSDDIFINHCNLLLASTIITSQMSYRSVENESLVNLIQYLQGDEVKYVPPGRQSFSNKIIPTMHKKVKELIKQELKEAEGISATLDSWSKNIDSDSFLSFTIHYIRNNEIKSRVLKLSDTFKSHESVFITEFINSVVQEFELERFKPFPIITDNAPNVMKGVEDANCVIIGCPCHRFNNAVEECLEKCEMYKNIVEKCQRIAVMIKRSKNWRNKLNDVQMEIFGSTLNPLLSVPTRWFSNFYLLYRIYQISAEYNGIVEAISSEEVPSEHQEEFKNEYLLTNDEIEMIAFIINILQLVLNKSELLSSQTIPSMGMIIPLYYQLLAELEREKSKILIENDYILIRGHNIKTTNGEFKNFKLLEESSLSFQDIIDYEEQNTTYIGSEEKHKFITELEKALKNKFENEHNIIENETVIISMILNPSYRFDYYEEGSIEAKRIQKRIKEICEKRMSEERNRYNNINRKKSVNSISDHYVETSTNNSNGNSVIINIDGNNGFEFDGRKRKPIEINEIEEYMNEYHPKEMTLQEILNYWENKKQTFKSLYKLSKKYICNIASSASSERLFSNASGYYSQKRSRMLASHLEDICICQSWINNEGVNAFDGMIFD